MFSGQFFTSPLVHSIFLIVFIVLRCAGFSVTKKNYDGSISKIDPMFRALVNQVKYICHVCLLFVLHGWFLETGMCISISFKQIYTNLFFHYSILMLLCDCTAPTMMLLTISFMFLFFTCSFQYVRLLFDQELEAKLINGRKLGGRELQTYFQVHYDALCVYVLLYGLCNELVKCFT